MQNLCLLSLLLSLVFGAGSAGASPLECLKFLQPDYGQKIEGLFAKGFGDQLVAELQPLITEKGHALEFRHHRVENIYEIYVEKRLSYLPADIQSKVRVILKTNVHVEVIRQKLFGSIGVVAQVDPSHSMLMSLKIPEALAGTVIEYAAKAHELEHIIQFLTVGSSGANPLHPRHYSHKFLMEKGAMRAEGTFLFLFSKGFLWEKSQRLSDHPEFNKATQKLVDSMLITASETHSVEEYLEKMWALNYYAAPEFNRLQLWLTVKYEAFVATLLASGGVLSTLLF